MTALAYTDSLSLVLAPKPPLINKVKRPLTLALFTGFSNQMVDPLFL